MMKVFDNPAVETWPELTRRPVMNLEALFPLVQSVFELIREKGDNAIINFTNQFDKVELPDFKVTEEEIFEVESLVSEELKTAIQKSFDNIYKFHNALKEQVREIETTPGVRCWRESRPIEKVGIYIPGGSAPLFSTVLMLGIPALIAGCREVVVCTPPDKFGKIHPAILFASQLVGATSIYKIGGIQAIGAMTIGTETVPRVSKIFGPGNQYVMAAKQVAQQYGVAIDMPAGPSEVMVIADESAIAGFVAADLLSQAEHGVDSQVMLITTSEKLAMEAGNALKHQLNRLPRKEVAEKALENSPIILFHRIEDCIAFSNAYAPEHLILAVDNPRVLVKEVINAGSVFLGNYSCESAGDYASGTNHTLPTNGYAKMYSGISVDSFIKKITFQELSAVGVKSLGRIVETMAEAEGLQAHKEAMSLRLNYIEESSLSG